MSPSLYKKGPSYQTKIPFPSLAGMTVIAKQAVLLAPDHCSPAPSQSIDASVTYCRTAPCYSGVTAPALHRLPY